MDIPQTGQLAILTFVLLTTIFAYWLFCSQILPVPETTHPSKPTKGRKTFRISGVPPDWDEDRLQSFLISQDDIVEPLIKSLTIDIDGHCSIGTATFQSVPKRFQNGSSWRIPLPRLPQTQSARDQYLVIDHALLGITPLYNPPPEDHSVDIIAISGLGGHAFGSFKERNGDHMWLRDSLPYEYGQSCSHPEGNGRTKDILALMRHCIALRLLVLGTDHLDTISSVACFAKWDNKNPSR